MCRIYDVSSRLKNHIKIPTPMSAYVSQEYKIDLYNAQGIVRFSYLPFCRYKR